MKVHLNSLRWISRLRRQAKPDRDSAPHRKIELLLVVSSVMRMSDRARDSPSRALANARQGRRSSAPSVAMRFSRLSVSLWRRLQLHEHFVRVR